MGMPTVYAVGTVASGIAGVTPGLPAGTVADDILILLLENQDATAVGTVTGYSVIQAPFASTGTATRLDVRWKRAVAGEAAPSVPDPGDHVVARIIGVRGCINGPTSPVHTSNFGTELVADTTVSIPGATTTKPNCLIIAAFSTGTDVASTAHASAWANAALGSVTERVDNWVIDSGGGGFGACSGTMAVAGNYGATTATCVTANFKALVSIALIGDTEPQWQQRGNRPSENPASSGAYAPYNPSSITQG